MLLISIITITQLFLLPFVFCRSKKKFESDGKANLIPRGNNPSLKSLKSIDESSSKQAPPTAQTPPSRTPIERSGTPEEDTLANVKSLPPEKSDAPLSGKKKKH
ncbi:hypothetical protein GCK72_000352 [Caenorhabditis remanei]|uniref:Uncharacterized protein n=1 Tax=Caenorhabditis remanei TaxID=31234 RepID=A0A6A5HK33_CAERE|nr:hypothetical protein GCK72_000352 [Caenorhabditis remanei]KAF1768540.1 hypothetical protein GCK72_000352 [Caenorhabditis remanei]